MEHGTTECVISSKDGGKLDGGRRVMCFQCVNTIDRQQSQCGKNVGGSASGVLAAAFGGGGDAAAIAYE